MPVQLGGCSGQFCNQVKQDNTLRRCLNNLEISLKSLMHTTRLAFNLIIFFNCLTRGWHIIFFLGIYVSLMFNIAGLSQRLVSWDLTCMLWNQLPCLSVWPWYVVTFFWHDVVTYLKQIKHILSILTLCILLLFHRISCESSSHFWVFDRKFKSNYKK